MYFALEDHAHVGHKLYQTSGDLCKLLRSHPSSLLLRSSSPVNWVLPPQLPCWLHARNMLSPSARNALKCWDQSSKPSHCVPDPRSISPGHRSRHHLLPHPTIGLEPLHPLKPAAWSFNYLPTAGISLPRILFKPWWHRALLHQRVGTSIGHCVVGPACYL